MGDRTLTIHTGSADETRALGARIAGLLGAGDVVLLHGDLGAGKTTLVQGLAGALGVAEPVQSPTFTLVHEYPIGDAARGIDRLYHLDLFRLGGEADLDSIGVAELLAPSDGIAVVEWPERAVALLPESYLLVVFEIVPDGRRVSLSAVPGDGPAAAIVALLAAAERAGDPPHAGAKEPAGEPNAGAGGAENEAVGARNVSSEAPSRRRPGLEAPG